MLRRHKALIAVATDDTTSAMVDIGEHELPKFLEVPTTFTSTTITVETTFDDGASWITLEAENGAATAWTLTVRAGRTQPSLIPLPPTITRGLRRLRFVTGSSEAGDRSLYLVTLEDPERML